MPNSEAAGALCGLAVAATHKRAGEPPRVAAGPARIARPNASINCNADDIDGLQGKEKSFRRSVTSAPSRARGQPSGSIARHWPSASIRTLSYSRLGKNDEAAPLRAAPRSDP